MNKTPQDGNGGENGSQSSETKRERFFSFAETNFESVITDGEQKDSIFQVIEN